MSEMVTETTTFGPGEAPELHIARLFDGWAKAGTTVWRDEVSDTGFEWVVFNRRLDETGELDRLGEVLKSEESGPSYPGGHFTRVGIRTRGSRTLFYLRSGYDI